MKITVIGVGNPLMGDDGVGEYIIDRLKREVGGEKLRLIKADTLLSVIDEIEETDELIIVDAIVSGKRPGTIIIEELREDANGHPLILSFSHGLYLETPKPLISFLKQNVKRITMIGIEAADFTIGKDLTFEVRQSADRVVKLILEIAGIGVLQSHPTPRRIKPQSHKHLHNHRDKG